MRSAQIRTMRYIVDRSFEGRKPHDCRTMRQLFGPDCIRAIRTHGKWATVRNDKWNIVIRTSMNLNHNPRLEHMEISDDRAFADFFQALADKIFATVPADTFTSLHNPELPGIDWHTPAGKVTAASLTGLKRPSWD